MMTNFRGLTKEGKMVQGDVVGIGDRRYIAPYPEVSYSDDSTERYCTIWGFIEVVPVTVGMQLGWKNKYDQEMWEGDILESDGGWRRVILYSPVDRYGWGFNSGADISSAFHWKVVGNIHQHPDMRLGEKENESS